MRIFPDDLIAFAPNNNACTQKISNVIKSIYDNPWSNYTKISTETRERWFQKWAVRTQCCLINCILTIFYFD
ncbi:uncharacterized protein DS421_18g616900 [Arachis hypogaea]|nr:uncharacterized protein DS421_18g616900 [Arachis hypogaea]